MAATKRGTSFLPGMRFVKAYYSVSFATLVLLDVVAIARSALGDRYSSVKQLGALDQIWVAYFA